MLAHQPLPECLQFIPWWGFVICIQRASRGSKWGADVQDRPDNEKDVTGNESSRIPFAVEEDAPSTELESKARISPGRIVRHKKLTHETNDDR
jgi:hypothetical protein